MSDATALATIDPRRDERAFEPSNAEEVLTIAHTLKAGGLIPAGLATPQAVFTVIMTGRELGLSTMQSLRSIHVINGKPTLSADLMVALVKRRKDVCHYFKLVESTADHATYETERDGEPGPTRLTWTMQQARTAGLGGGNWKKFPDAMLRARCGSALARAVYPDVVGGLYDPDELGMDARAPVSVANPAPVPAPAPTVEVLPPAPVPTPVPTPEPEPEPVTDAYPLPFGLGDVATKGAFIENVVKMYEDRTDVEGIQALTRDVRAVIRDWPKSEIGLILDARSAAEDKVQS